jgi:3-methylfumaryl-CoA hydratase
MTAEDANRWGDWIGRSQSAQDVLTPSLVEGFYATLDRAPATEWAPQGIHWLCAPPRVRRGQLGGDGHPAVGDFLPAVDLPRRMWASSRVEFLAPLRVGGAVDRASSIKSITEKMGSSGPLVFVEVEHVFTSGGAVCVREVQTIVYREAPSGPVVLAEPSDQPRDWPWIAVWPTDPVLLFRYSALTFNGHRIHYDQPYATQVEGYPGLVTHGPLMATLMLDLCERNMGPDGLASFAFRGLGPAFCGETLIVAAKPEGEHIELKVFTEDGRTVMSGQAVARAGA